MYSADDDKAGSDFVQRSATSNWSYSAAAGNNGFAYCANHSFGKSANVSAVNFTLGASGDTSAGADCVGAIVTFTEDTWFAHSASLELPQTRLNLKQLPNKVFASILDGLDS